MDKKNILDKSTQFTKRAIDVLLLPHPQRTALGVIVGLSINIIEKLLFPFLKGITWINFSEISQWEYIILGIALLHLPTIKMLFQQKPELPEKYESAIAMIRRAGVEGGVPKDQIALQYLDLCKSSVKEVDSDEVLTTRKDPQLKE